MIYPRQHYKHGMLISLSMSIGLENAPVVSMGLINRVFESLLGKFKIMFRDEIQDHKRAMLITCDRCYRFFVTVSYMQSSLNMIFG